MNRYPLHCALPWALAILLSLVMYALHAQSWCPPGASWTYRMHGWAYEGCEIRTYVGDTIIDGKACQRIAIHAIGTEFQPEQHVERTGTVHTYSEDGVVFIRGEFPYPAEWDTLYWFSAPVGARWQTPGEDTWCGMTPVPMWEVMSVEEAMIAGITLRRLELGGWRDGELEPAFPITERIGSFWMTLPPLCATWEVHGAVLRYRDDTWDGFDDGADAECLRFNGIAEHQAPVVTVYPNPSIDRVEVRWAGPLVSNVQVTIIDMMGRRVPVRSERTGDLLVLDVGGLAPGPYHLLVQQGIAVLGRASFHVFR